MSKPGLMLVHSAPEVQEAAARARKPMTSGAPNAYEYAYRENTLRKEVGKLAMDRLHNTLASDARFDKLEPHVQLGFIKEALDRAYGKTMAPAREPADPNSGEGPGSLRDQLAMIAARGNLPEMLRASRASEAEPA